MFNLRTLSVITLTIASCALASHASAQTHPIALEKAQPILSQPSLTVKSAEAARKLGSNTAETHKITRVVTPLPAQGFAKPQQKSVYSGIINANASERNAPTRFVYSRRKDHTIMPVYFSEEANKSR